MNKITRIRCLIPFTRLNIYRYGICFSCCPGWNYIGHIGQIKDENSIMNVWNSENILELRKAVLDDELEKVCDFVNCPIAAKNQYIDLEEMKKNSHDSNLIHTLELIIAGEYKMDRLPYFVQISNFGKCNLKCIMCELNDRVLHTDYSYNEKLFHKVMKKLLPGISILSLSGSGEVFFNQYTRNFLQTLNNDDYPLLKIEIYTNGLLLTPKLWNTIRHNHYDSIYVSCDAATKTTYEKIRKNGRWDQLRCNLDFIGRLRKEGVFRAFNICFVVMKSNYKEIKSFVELGLQLGCDQIIFQKITGNMDIRENINSTNNKKVFKKIAGILEDPLFKHPAVDIDSIKNYRKYCNYRITINDYIKTKCIETFFYFPSKILLKINKYFPITHIVSEFMRRKNLYRETDCKKK